MNHLEKVKQVFDQACDVPEGERAVLLDAACAGDGQLRAEVEDLLNANAEAEQFLAAPLLPLLARQPEPQSQAGRVIDRYRLLSEIGRGGMAMVYLAERIDEYHQQVALKLVWPSADSEEIHRRFKQERQILASLDHPNIARLLDGGTTEDGAPYLVMEYIAGQPITHYCREHKLPLADRLRLFQTVCAAVAHAHRNLIVHRDIKPSNILVTPAADGKAGMVKLLDFGIAKLLAPGLEQQQTVTGFRPMTLEYASPEQMREEAMTTSTDIYSLGVLLYELLTGGHPHDLKAHPTHEIIRIVCEVDPPPPSARNPQLRGDLDNIVLLALRKEPGQRYQTVEQFSEDISRFLAGEPVSARPSTLRYRAGKYLRRNKTVVIAAAIVLLMLLGMLANEMRRARSFQAEVYERNRQIYSFDMNRAMQAWQDNDLSGMNATLEKYLPKPGGEDWRGFEWRYLWRLAHQEEQSIELPGQILSGSSIQQDRYLLIREENLIRIYDVATGQQRHSWPIKDFKGIPDIYEKDRVWIVENAHEINTYDLSTGQRVNSFRDDGAPLFNVFKLNDREFITQDDLGLVKVRDIQTKLVLHSFHTPANARLFFGIGSKYLVLGDSRTVIVLNTQTGHPIVSFTESDEFESVGQTDGRLSVSLLGKLISLRELPSGRLIAKIGAGQGGPFTATPSPDGRIMATGGQDGSIKFWEAETGRELETLANRHHDWVTSMQFSQDVKWLVSASSDRTLKLWDVNNRREVVTLKGHTNEIDYVRFFSDDQRLISLSFIEGEVKIWDLAKVLQPTALTGHEDSIYAVAVSPDNRHIASVSRDKTAIIWDMVTGAQQTLRGHTDQVFAVAFSPDGQQLATGGNDGVVIVWDIASGRETGGRFNNLPAQRRYGVSYAVRSLTFTPNGRTLLVGSGDGTVKYWDWAENNLRRVLIAHNLPNRPEPEVVSLRFSPDNKLLATASMEGTAKIWDFATGNLIATLTGHKGYVWAAVFSPDGKLLATCGHDRTIKLWDTATWLEVVTLTGHSDEVFSVAFSPDGSRLASASNDDTVKLWDVARRQEVLTLKDHTDQVWSVAFMPDGQTMVTGSWDKTVRLYRAGK
ncbi:MAG: protein kinase [Acidobacteriota bacterium]